MGSARPHHFDVGGPLCDTWAPKPCNAAQSGRKRAQIVLKSTKKRSWSGTRSSLKDPRKYKTNKSYKGFSITRDFIKESIEYN